mmetsp:Transcript_9734/g.16399  ORF Transcript_9734/g.16399 Transcript_9734/m.16399 type:complete len:104 (-) Transcript_9734:199-510(-)
MLKFKFKVKNNEKDFEGIEYQRFTQLDQANLLPEKGRKFLVQPSQANPLTIRRGIFLFLPSHLKPLDSNDRPITSLPKPPPPKPLHNPGQGNWNKNNTFGGQS